MPRGVRPFFSGGYQGKQKVIEFDRGTTLQNEDVKVYARLQFQTMKK